MPPQPQTHPRRAAAVVATDDATRRAAVAVVVGLLVIALATRAATGSTLPFAHAAPSGNNAPVVATVAVDGASFAAADGRRHAAAIGKSGTVRDAARGQQPPPSRSSASGNRVASKSPRATTPSHHGQRPSVDVSPWGCRVRSQRYITGTFVRGWCAAGNVSASGAAAADDDDAAVAAATSAGVPESELDAAGGAVENVTLPPYAEGGAPVVLPVRRLYTSPRCSAVHRATGGVVYAARPDAGAEWPHRVPALAVAAPKEATTYPAVDVSNQLLSAGAASCYYLSEPAPHYVFQLEGLYAALSRAARRWRRPAARETGAFAHAARLKVRKLPPSVEVAFLSMPQRHYLGGVMGHFLEALAQLHAIGALRRDPQLVMPSLGPPNSTERRVTAWVWQYYDGAKPLEIGDNEALVAPGPAVFTQAAFETQTPCLGAFLGDLLPRVVAAMRRNASFPYGDAALRGGWRRDLGPPSTSSSSAGATSGVSSLGAWYASLPRKIFLVKSSRHTISAQRTFRLGPATHRRLAQQGFVEVRDDAPMDHRMALVNAADVLVTTWGALLVMMGSLYAPTFRRASFDDSSSASGDAAAAHERELPVRPPLRVIVLVHPGYRGEYASRAVAPVRRGTQAGATVSVSDWVWLSQQSRQWFKTIAFSGGNLDELLHDEHLSFTAADCTLDPAAATDFPSRLVEAGRLKGVDVPLRTRDLARTVPGYDGCLNTGPG